MALCAQLLANELFPFGTFLLLQSDSARFRIVQFGGQLNDAFGEFALLQDATLLVGLTHTNQY